MAIRQAGVATSGCQLATASYSFTLSGGVLTNGVLVVGVAGLTVAGSVSGITVNSVPMLLKVAASNGLADSEIWYLANPGTGLLTIAVTMSGAVDSVAVALLYEGVNMNAPLEASNSATGTNSPASVSVTTVTPQAWVVDAIATANKTLVVGGSQLSRSNQVCTAGSGASSDLGPITTPASTAMSWTGIGVTDVWAYCAVSLRPFYELRAMGVM